MEVQIRPSKSEDRNFIIATWLKGQLYGDPFFSSVPPEIFFLNFSTQIERILADPDVRVEVACLAEDADVILAYIVFKGPSIAWAFTKQPWRGQGLMNKLTQPHNFKVSSSVTKPGRAIMIKKGVQHNPWAI